MQLPQAYIQQMKQQLPPEHFQAFIESYQKPRQQALRINPLKVSEPEQLRLLKQTFHLEPVSWCDTGYYYEDAKPGKHPWHAAGVYYIQEPSAMSSAELLDPQPGETVLDLAAAPGGKTTQIAAKMKGSGLLVANEIHPGRARILSENVERFGIVNAIVTSSTPQALAEAFPQHFDRIMLDAPCSGEGMFRKDPEAVGEWSEDHVRMCAQRQLDILPSAALMLKPGGTLVYSTCTFNRSENEEVIAAFLEQHDDFECTRTERIWPHLQRGEGHFVAVLKRHSYDHEDKTRHMKSKKKGRHLKAPKEAALLTKQFCQEVLPRWAVPEGELFLLGEQVYNIPLHEGLPFDLSKLDRIKTLRFGLHMGTIKKQRFDPSHALALAVPRYSDSTSYVKLDSDSSECAAYLRGETLPNSGKGWTLVSADAYPIGWGKSSGGILKNHYPKGLRWM
ncbi:RsmF rRNA methyltransferase first C-terminal domain-containing protein [Marinicrinis lubricantis]|uniref:RsmF rRNA methyltransferase first C-terminal domain-containing protein n=1 Tax=Marinicrinis lubricantis TaxID=2086470 RepID=A0ABW1IU16_9BACL